MDTLQPNVGAAISITYSAALVAFILRFFARRWNGAPFIAGDWVSAVAFVGFQKARKWTRRYLLQQFFVTAFNVLYLIKLRFGLGLHCEDIAQRNHHGGIDYDSMTRDYFLLLYPDMWLYTGAMGLSKMTALALYWRLFGKSITRYWILLLEGCVVWWMFARFVVILAVCHPISRLWNRNGSGHCRVNMVQFFYSSTVHLAMEMCIVALPWYEIRRLKRAEGEKIAIAAMFSSGILVCIASLVQMILATQLNTTSQELWWINTPQAIASIVEINLGYFATSLPNLRPVLRCFKSGKIVRPETTKSNSPAGAWRPSNSHTAVSPDADPVPAREQMYEGLVTQPGHVVAVDRVTSWKPGYNRPLCLTEIGSLRNFQVEPPSNVHSPTSYNR